MERVANLFKNGRSQAVRLPVDFAFDAKQVYIRKESNGDVILSVHSQKKSSWEQMWLALDNAVSEDFLTPEERSQETNLRDPFEGINL